MPTITPVEAPCPPTVISRIGGYDNSMTQYIQLFAVLVAARQLRTALFAREIRKIPHTEASSPAYILGYMR